MTDRLSIEEYRARLEKTGVQLSSAPCAGARMTAAEFRRQQLSGDLPSRTKALPKPPTAPTGPKVASVEGSVSPDPKKRRSQPEFDEQKSLFYWAREPAVLNQLPALRLLSASLNGVKLTKAQAGKAKAAGMLEGESDVRLPVARGRWIGLIIEMKAGKNKATEAQMKYGHAMEAEGYQFHVCYSWLRAKEVVELYLSHPRPAILAASDFKE